MCDEPQIQSDIIGLKSCANGQKERVNYILHRFIKTYCPQLIKARVISLRSNSSALMTPVLTKRGLGNSWPFVPRRGESTPTIQKQMITYSYSYSTA